MPTPPADRNRSSGSAQRDGARSRSGVAARPRTTATSPHRPPSSARRTSPTSPRRTAPRGLPPSLWRSAAWSGVSVALVASVVAIVAVAVVWLPASGPSGNAGSTLRAGLLTFLAALHGGITVDGYATGFVPLGLTLLVGWLAWRAGDGFADTVEELRETDRRRLVQAAAVQAGSFAVSVAVLAALATLGTSSVSPFAALVAGFVLFAVTGGIAFLRGTVLRDRAVGPSWLGPATRTAAVALIGYVAAGAVLVAGALVVEHDRVMTLSREVGGGWSGIPVLLLGVLAAPNAAIAGAGYLSGAGFAVGHGTDVSLTVGAHGAVPAFPVLGALPTRPADPMVWALAAVTLLVTGLCVARAAGRGGSRLERWRTLGAGTVLTVLFGIVLAWLGGGGLGPGRLAVVGVPPWRLGLTVGVGTAVVGAVALALLELRFVLAGRHAAAAPVGARPVRAVTPDEIDDDIDDDLADEADDERAEEDQPARGAVRSTFAAVKQAITVSEDEKRSGRDDKLAG